MDRMTPVEELQEELKVLKNEIKTTLMDIRDHLLTYVENPFPITFGREETQRQAANAHRAAAGPEIDPLVQPGNGSNGGGKLAPLHAMPSLEEPTYDADRVVPQSSIATTVGGAPLFALGHEAQPREPTAEKGMTEMDRPGLGEKKEATAKPEAAQGQYGKPQASKQEPAQDGPASSELDGDEHSGSLTGESGPSSRSREGIEPDLLTVATLASWLDESIRKVGRKRVRTIIEVYSSMGGLSPKLQEVLFRLISLDDTGDTRANVPLRECLHVLAELDNLMWRARSDRTGAALMSALLGNWAIP